jgi:serine/threonine protein kinase
VYLCAHKLDGNTYCIKKIRITGRREEDPSRMIKKTIRAIREARCLSRLSHPNVIRYYNSWLELTSPEAQIAHKLKPPTKQNDSPVELFTESSNSVSGLRFESMSFIGDTSSASSDFDIQPASTQALIRLPPPYAHASASDDDRSSDFSGSSSEEEDSRDLSGHIASQLALIDSASTHFDITLYLQMESCLEFTLSNVLKEMRDGSKQVPLIDRVQCMCEVAEALQHTHLSGIVHRDIKPDNIFFKWPRSAKLADFGLSKESANDAVMDEIIKFSGSGEGSGSDVGDSPSLTALSDQELTTSCGTVSCVTQSIFRKSFCFCLIICGRYAAPEQLASHVATTHADVFSFGIVLAEMMHPCGSFMEREQVHGMSLSRNAVRPAPLISFMSAVHQPTSQRSCS